MGELATAETACLTLLQTKTPHWSAQNWSLPGKALLKSTDASLETSAIAEEGNQLEGFSTSSPALARLTDLWAVSLFLGFPFPFPGKLQNLF